MPTITVNVDDALKERMKNHPEAIWSDDSDFNEQDLVSVFTTGEVIGSFDTV